MTTPRAIAGIVMLLAAALALGCTAQTPQAQTLNRAGNQRYTAGNYAGALTAYEQASVLRPDLPALNYNAGNALIHQTDYQRSIQQEQQAAESSDPSVQERADYSLGNDYVRLNQLPQAVDAYKSALRLNPSDVDAKYNLEVVERRVAAAAKRQAEAKQLGTPTPTPTRPPQPAGASPTPAAAAQQGQTGQPGQGQPGQGQPGQAGQPGQGQPGQAGQPGQPGQNGQGQPGQSGQPGPATGTQAGQPGAIGGSSSGVSGYTGTPGGSPDTLDPAIQRALAQFDQTGQVGDAQQALDAIAQLERARQQARGGSPQSQTRDW